MTEQKASGTSSKGMIWTGRILGWLPSLLMLFGVVMSILNPSMVTEGLGKYGYPANTAMPLIMVEALCVILYLIPRTSVLGAILLTGYLGGAVSTHVRAGEMTYFIPAVLGMVFWFGLYLQDSRIRALIPIRR